MRQSGLTVLATLLAVGCSPTDSAEQARARAEVDALRAELAKLKAETDAAGNRLGRLVIGMGWPGDSRLLLPKGFPNFPRNAPGCSGTCQSFSRLGRAHGG